MMNLDHEHLTLHSDRLEKFSKSVAYGHGHGHAYDPDQEFRDRP